MSKHLSAFDLPEDIQAELFRRAAALRLGGYRSLEGWLKEAGHPVSKSSLQRALAQFQPALEIIRRARFIEQASNGAISAEAAIQIAALQDLAAAIRQAGAKSNDGGGNRAEHR